MGGRAFVGFDDGVDKAHDIGVAQRLQQLDLTRARQALAGGGAGECAVGQAPPNSHEPVVRSPPSHRLEVARRSVSSLLVVA
jgi:hypothetical protein